MKEYVIKQDIIDRIGSLIEKDANNLRLFDYNDGIRDAITAVDEYKVLSGHWNIESAGLSCSCSECLSVYGIRHTNYNFCPNCGSKNKD